MIIKTQLEKNKLNNSKKEALLMVSLLDETKLKTVKRKPLNISVAIDVSGSMDWPLVSDNSTSFSPFLGFDPFSNKNTRMIDQKASKSRLSLAKESLINMLSALKDGDIISVVSFSFQSQVVISPTQVNSENLNQLISVVNGLRASGGTNLHDGWLESVKMISKNYSNKYVNRSIILSDGDITVGEQNPSTIKKNVLNVSNENISTSTFGFGSNFNEDLLQLISNSGAGNSYYVEKLCSFQEQLEIEFSGLTSTTGTLVRMEFNPGKNVSIKNDYNQYQKEGGKYILPNLLNNKAIDILFELDYKTKSKTQFNLGSIKLSYKDGDGNICEFNQEVKVSVCDDTNWETLPSNDDIKARSITLTIANDKERAIKEMDLGNFSGATSILQASSAMASCNASLSAGIGAEVDSLNDLLDKDLSQDDGILRKTLSYDSYISKRI